jgi:hypothetical protein
MVLQTRFEKNKTVMKIWRDNDTDKAGNQSRKKNFGQ